MTDVTVRAAAFARSAHDGQLRKGTDLSYFDGHLEPVARLVAEAGGSDTQIAAAYLHDAAEDAGGSAMLAQIQEEFGQDVASIVRHLSDSLIDTTAGEDKEDWATRKRRYTADLAAAPPSALEVSVADKCHNAESIRDDYRELGPALWGVFNEKRPDYQLWYYSALTRIFERRIPDHPLTPRLAECVATLTDLVRADVAGIDRRVELVRARFDGDASDPREA